MSKLNVTADRTVSTIHYVDISISIDEYDNRIGDEDEVVLRLNGKMVKRMDKFAATRFGLVTYP